MPVPTLMVMANKGAGGTVQPYFLLGGTTLDPTPDGTAFTASQFTPTTVGASQANMMIEAFGKRYLLHAGVVRERDQGGSGNWGAVHTASPAPSLIQGTYSTSGLHLLFPNGVPTLAFFSATSSFGLYRHWSTDGVSWSTSLAFGNALAIFSHARSIVFGDSIFWGMNLQNASGIHAFDFKTNAHTLWDTNSFTNGGLDLLTFGDFLVHKGKLFFYTDFGTNYAQQRGLYRLDGANWTKIIFDTTGTSTASLQRGMAFSDGDDIICLGRNFGPGRPVMIRVQSPHTTTTPTYSFVDVFTTASTPLFGLSGSFTLGNGGQWYAVKDITDPNTPVVYLWWQAGASINAGTYDCFQYNGWTTPLTFLGNGVASSTFTLVGGQTLVGSGDRIPAKPAARPQFDGLPTQGALGRRRFFRIYGTGSDVTLQQTHSADQEDPTTISTLVASSITLQDSVNVTGLVGNLGEVALEALSPSSGDAYVVSATDGDSTLNPGALAIAVGDIVQYTGSAWVQAVANSGGFPPFGTHATLNSTTALIAPYTDGVDDGKVASFAGASLTGTVLSTPSNTTTQMVVTPDEGASLWSYIHNTYPSGDNLVAGTVHTVTLDPV